MTTQRTVTYPAVLTHTAAILPSLCGADKHLSIVGAFSLLVDAAAIHSERIGTGCREMAARGHFWLMTRARIRFHHRPGMMEEATLTTWPRAPRHYLCDRYFTLEAAGDTLLEGRQEWAVIDRKSGRPVRTEGVYPEGFAPLPSAILDTPFARMRDTLGEGDTVGHVTVASSDIDFGQHLNNARYWRYITDTFSVGEQAALTPREAEIAYVASCFEGERLTLLRRREEEGYLFSIRKEDGTTAALARILTA